MKLSRGEKIFEVLNYVFLVVLSLFFLIPFISVLAVSFVGVEEWARRGAFILIPEKIDLTAYKLLLNRGSIAINAYGITLFRVVVGTVLNLAFTSTLAYALARRDLPGRTFMTFLVFFTMLFSGGIIPRFMLLDTLGLLDTVWIMILPRLISSWNLLIMRNFFMAIPSELEEAAIVDGATPPLVLLRIILPLSLPAISTIGLFYAVSHWNAWFYAAIFIKDIRKWPVQVILRGVLERGIVRDPENMIEVEVLPPAATLKAAMIIITTVPVLCVYPFIQQYFVKGVMVGAVKG